MYVGVGVHTHCMCGVQAHMSHSTQMEARGQPFKSSHSDLLEVASLYFAHHFIHQTSLTLSSSPHGCTGMSRDLFFGSYLHVGSGALTSS